MDLLSGALGAVIFLFIVTPKGGESPAIHPQAMLAIDTLNHKIFCDLPDSLYNKRVGDTLLVLIKDYEEMPSKQDCPKCPEIPKVKNRKPYKHPVNEEIAFGKKTSPDTQMKKIPVSVEKNNTKLIAKTKLLPPLNEKARVYKGDPPGVPCQASFEINWKDKNDNVDLYVCKDKQCVYGKGGKRKHKTIGQWDSGKSKNRVFGDDLRTTQEAVRQFDKIIPGKYKVYAQYKETNRDKASIEIQGLIYTKNDDGKEKGKRFYKTLSLDKNKKTLLGTIDLKENGDFTFIKN